LPPSCQELGRTLGEAHRASVSGTWHSRLAPPRGSDSHRSSPPNRAHCSSEMFSEVSLRVRRPANIHGAAWRAGHDKAQVCRRVGDRCGRDGAQSTQRLVQALRVLARDSARHRPCDRAQHTRWPIECLREARQLHRTLGGLARWKEATCTNPYRLDRSEGNGTPDQGFDAAWDFIAPTTGPTP